MSCALLLARASTSHSVTIGRNAIARGLCLTGGPVPLFRSGCEGSAVEDSAVEGRAAEGSRRPGTSEPRTGWDGRSSVSLRRSPQVLLA